MQLFKILVPGLLFLLFVNVTKGQQFLLHGKSLKSALKKLENKYVYVIAVDSSCFAGKLYILDNFGNAYYVISSRNDRKKQKLYLNEILDVDLLPKLPDVRVEQMILNFENPEYVKLFLQRYQLNIQHNNQIQNDYIPNPILTKKSLDDKTSIKDDKEYEEVKYTGFNKAIFSYTAFPMESDLYVYMNLLNGFQAGYKPFKNFEVEGGINLIPFYTGSSAFFIQPKLVTSFSGNFNLSYMININKTFEILEYFSDDYNHFHLINLMIGDYNYWINLGMGSSLTNKNQAIYAVTSGIKLLQSTFLIAEAFRFNKYVEYVGLNLRYALENGYFELGVTGGNQIIKYKDYFNNTFIYYDRIFTPNIGFVYKINTRKVD